MDKRTGVAGAACRQGAKRPLWVTIVKSIGSFPLSFFMARVVDKLAGIVYLLEP